MTQPGSLDFSTSTSRVEDPNSNYVLTSSCSGSRALNSVSPDFVSFPNYPGSSDEGLFLPISSYVPSSSGPAFPVSMMPTMSSLDSTPYDDFLANTSVSMGTSAEATYVSAPYPGQGSCSQDMINSFLDMSMCGPPMMSNFYGPEGNNWASSGRPHTPPPEEFIQEYLPYYTGPQDIQDDMSSGDQDLAMYELNDMTNSSAHRSDCRKKAPRTSSILT